MYCWARQWDGRKASDTALPGCCGLIARMDSQPSAGFAKASPPEGPRHRIKKGQRFPLKSGTSRQYLADTSHPVKPLRKHSCSPLREERLPSFPESLFSLGTQPELLFLSCTRRLLVKFCPFCTDARLRWRHSAAFCSPECPSASVLGRVVHYGCSCPSAAPSLEVKNHSLNFHGFERAFKSAVSP